MKRIFALLAFCLSQAAYIWCQACPSSTDLHKLPADLPMCVGVSPLGWHYESSITVYISDIFTPAQQKAIANAYYNWNIREKAGLVITPQVFNTVIIGREFPSSVWQIVNDPDPNCENRSACTHDNWCPTNGYEFNTSTNVHPTYSGTGDQLFPHEVGHTYGFDDCTGGDCEVSVTIMNPNEADMPFAPMSPRCCDSKVMYTISGGDYGQSGQYCSPGFVQGVYFLTDYDTTSVSATFPQPPQSGDTIVAGCEEYENNVPPMMSDNQSVGGLMNNYNPPIVSTVDPYLDAVPVALYVSPDIVSSQTTSFTITCSESYRTVMSLFALEYYDLGSTGNIVDSTGSNESGTSGGADPYPCTTTGLSTSVVNDLIMTIYNNDTDSTNAGIGPVAPWAIPTCSGNGYGNSCVAQNGQVTVVGGVSTYIAPMGQYTPAWYGPMVLESCATAALKPIGP